jgi:putative ABC transport system permease protein
LKRILLAFTIATAVSWFALHKWLENFAHRIDLAWWIFVLAGVLVFILAQLTIGWQIIRAAKTNPVESLRYD